MIAAGKICSFMQGMSAVRKELVLSAGNDNGRAALAGGYRYVQVIGLKVKYDEQVLREAEHSPQRTEELRQETYEAAKKKMLQALLALEREFPGSTTIMAGGCTLCRTCARAKGESVPIPGKDAVFLFRAWL